MKTVNDPTYDFVKSIYLQHIPQQSELSNPFSANKRQRKKTLSTRSKEIPADYLQWSPKNFSDYFGTEYKRVFDGVYKITYTSDNKIINIIMEFMIENGLDKNEWTKKFIDWCFLNKGIILQRSGHFLLPELPNFLNRYYQDVISTNSTIALMDIFPDVKLLASEGKSKELFSKYGIPIACTYYATYKNISDEQLISGLRNLFNQLSKGNIQEKKLLSDIIQKSISRSPYPSSFKILEWRETFMSEISKYKTETWWRADDYPGQPRFKIEKFLNG
jgi:hypothetical protein